MNPPTTNGGSVSQEGTVVAIYVAPEGAAGMVKVDAVRALVGKGLEGDRYATGVGTYSAQPGTGREVTLIETEALESLERESGVALDPAESRRNIVTRGLSLNDLVGQEFRVGTVTLRGVRLCEPCGHLEKLTRPGVRGGLVHRGGLRADIVQGGTIRPADLVTSPVPATP